MYSIIDALVDLFFEAIPRLLGVSRETYERWQRYYMYAGILFVILALFALLALIAWVNLQ